MDLVRTASAPPPGTPDQVNQNEQEQEQQTVYVEAAPEDLANVTVASGVGGGPIHLTTITVAVPEPLSPSDVLQQHVVTSAPHQVTLPTVPAPQETATAVRWKYDKQDKNIQNHQTGTSLVRTKKAVFNLDDVHGQWIALDSQV